MFILAPGGFPVILALSSWVIWNINCSQYVWSWAFAKYIYRKMDRFGELKYVLVFENAFQYLSIFYSPLQEVHQDEIALTFGHYDHSESFSLQYCHSRIISPSNMANLWYLVFSPCYPISLPHCHPIIPIFLYHSSSFPSSKYISLKLNTTVYISYTWNNEVW